MTIPTSFDELLAAFEWVTAGDAEAIECSAYVSKVDGKVYWSGEGIDEALPENVDDTTRFVAVPRKSEFDLGRLLALRFVENHVPYEVDTVEQHFRKHGAYARFKSLLAREGKLDEWHRYQENAIADALQKWSEEHGLVLEGAPNRDAG